MSEKFNRERVRFHVYRPDVLVIQGWFENDREGAEAFCAQIDGKDVPLKVTTQQGIEVRKKYLRYKADIDVEYFLWISLKEEGAWLRVYHRAAEGDKLLYKSALPALRNKRESLNTWM